LLEAQSTSGTTNLSCDILINAAGLGAENIARSINGFPAEKVPKIYFAKGEFYSLSGKAPFSHLVVPPPALLARGGSLTIDMGGQAKLGPDLSFVEHREYSVAADAAEKFAGAAGNYWPAIDVSRLTPGYAGIRPRVTGPGEPPGDWLVTGPADHGIAGIVHLFGMDTPGLTSCLAIANHVLEKLEINESTG